MSKEISKDDLKEMIRGAVRESLAEQEKAREERPLENPIEHVCGCPDCYCETIKHMNKISDYVCPDCGLPLGDADFARKVEKCPNCGSKDPAKKVERPIEFPRIF